jgi:hypothetical protein
VEALSSCKEKLKGGTKMTKKDYKLIANAVQNMVLTSRDRQHVVAVLCYYLGMDNPSFNVRKFEHACLEVLPGPTVGDAEEAYSCAQRQSG